MTALGIVAALVVAQAAGPPTHYFKTMDLAGPEGGEKRLKIYVPLEKLPRPKVCPKHGWMYEWSSTGMVRTPQTPDQWSPRFRVFEQHRGADELGPRVTRMLLRLWDYNSQQLRLDHTELYRRLVDVYLAFGGRPGGEQLFTVDRDERDEHNRPRRVNVFYIYQVTTFTKPFEMAREVAHEYGHASLPPIGIFNEPEDWANGHLGEMLYLRWLRDDIAAERLTPRDALGATVADLDAYLARTVEPLLVRVATNGPNGALIAANGPESMNQYLGVAMWAERLLPPRALGRALMLSDTTNPRTFVQTVVDAAAELPYWRPRIPDSLRGKPVWLPVGAGRVEGGRVLSQAGRWARVQPTGALRVVNR